MNSSSLVIVIFAIVTFHTATFAKSPLFKVECTFSPKSVKVAKSAKLIVTLTALESTKINEEAPLSLEVKLGPELTSSKNRFMRSDAQKNEKLEASWEIPVSTNKAGNAMAKGVLSFYLCTDKWCRKFEHTFNEKLVVAP